MVLVFAARLIVQLPMYWSHDVAALGTARLVMGVPLYALVLWFGWLISRPATRPQMKSNDTGPEDDSAGEKIGRASCRERGEVGGGARTITDDERGKDKDS